jgi:hypothetical protein
VYNGIVCGVIEMKTFWKVSSESIDEVLNGKRLIRTIWMTKGTAPISGYHAGRLAIEQTYGYMVRNGKQIGILTTVNGFVFLFRQNQGKLYMTRMLLCESAMPTILQILYYMSALVTQLPNLPETDSSGMPIQIPAANYKYPNPAPQVPDSKTGESGTIGGVNSSTSHGQVQYILKLQESECPTVVFEPWVKENKLGIKTFLLQLNSEGTVVGKLWDGFKHDSKRRDQEVAVYLKLQTLWGMQVPKLIGCAEIDFFGGILLERIKVESLMMIADVFRDRDYLLLV